MNRWVLICMLVIAVPVGAQELDLSSLEGLREASDDVVSVSLGPEVLAFANAFLSDEDYEEAAALQVTEGLEAIEVRVFEFDGPGQYDPEALDVIWQQLEAEEWNRIVEVDEEGEEVSVWMYMEPGAEGTSASVGGMAVIVEGADEVVLVNIVGFITPEDLRALGAQFDLDDLEDLANLPNLGDIDSDDDDNGDDDRDED